MALLQLEPPPRWYMPCAEQTGQRNRSCDCGGHLSDGTLCGGCCSCAGGCIARAEEEMHWGARMRLMRGEQPLCTCFYGGPPQHPMARAMHARVFHINPACPHHGESA